MDESRTAKLYEFKTSRGEGRRKRWVGRKERSRLKFGKLRVVVVVTLNTRGLEGGVCVLGQMRLANDDG